MSLPEVIEDASRQIGLHLTDKQVEAIQSFLSGNDVFVSLPTGYGKSIIYAILPLIYDRIRGKVQFQFTNIRLPSYHAGKKGSLILCISPLTAIMMDQRAKFVGMGISAEYVGEGQKDPTAWRRVLNGEVQLIYISPENLLCNPQYRNMLRSGRYKENLVGVVVDEAHCVKTW